MAKIKLPWVRDSAKGQKEAAQSAQQQQEDTEVAHASPKHKRTRLQQLPNELDEQDQQGFGDPVQPVVLQFGQYLQEGTTSFQSFYKDARCYPTTTHHVMSNGATYPTRPSLPQHIPAPDEADVQPAQFSPTPLSVGKRVLHRHVDQPCSPQATIQLEQPGNMPLGTAGIPRLSDSTEAPANTPASAPLESQNNPMPSKRKLTLKFKTFRKVTAADGSAAPGGTPAAQITPLTHRSGAKHTNDGQRSSSSLNHRTGQQTKRQLALRSPPGKGASQELRDSMRKVLMAIQKRDPLGIFALPVTEDQAPGYFNVIPHELAMDLATAAANAKKGHYTTWDALEADLRQMYENAVRYNGADSNIGKLAVMLKAYSVDAIDIRRKGLSLRGRTGQLTKKLKSSNTADDSHLELKSASTMADASEPAGSNMGKPESVRQMARTHCDGGDIHYQDISQVPTAKKIRGPRKSTARPGGDEIDRRITYNEAASDEFRTWGGLFGESFPFSCGSQAHTLVLTTFGMSPDAYCKSMAKFLAGSSGKVHQLVLQHVKNLPVIH